MFLKIQVQNLKAEGKGIANKFTPCKTSIFHVYGKQYQAFENFPTVLLRHFQLTYFKQNCRFNTLIKIWYVHEIAISRF